MQQIWDISPPVRLGTPVFPGDTPFEQRWVANIGPGCPVNVSTLTLSPHTGAHADAPMHYEDGAAAIGAVSLAPFIGPCRVIHAIGVKPLVTLAHIVHALPGLGSALPTGAQASPTGIQAFPPRILVRTYAKAPLDEFDPDCAAFAPETIEALADLGVLLVGIDTASVDPADSKTLDSHQVLRRRDLRVLENLVLDEVPEGDYELIALPLKLTTADASPVRAILRRAL